jgi:hypothetical protein
MNVNNWFGRSVLAPIKSHSAEILLGAGLIGGLSAIGLAVVGTIKALPLLEKRKEELNAKKLPVGEILKTTWRCYMPMATTAIFSAGCIIGSNHANVRKIVALNAAYGISEVALSEYQKKVTEVFGPEKERAVRDSIDEDRITQNPVSQNTIIITDGGEHLCYDSASGRYFKSSMDRLVKASNTTSRVLLDEMYISLNDFYDEIGLSHISIGNDIGWSVTDGLIELSFSSHVTFDGDPCLVLNFAITPRPDFRNR